LSDQGAFSGPAGSVLKASGGAFSVRGNVPSLYDKIAPRNGNAPGNAALG
jgi:hypothetical protein